MTASRSVVRNETRASSGEETSMKAGSMTGGGEKLSGICCIGAFCEGTFSMGASEDMIEDWKRKPYTMRIRGSCTNDIDSRRMLRCAIRNGKRQL